MMVGACHGGPCPRSPSAELPGSPGARRPTPRRGVGVARARRRRRATGRTPRRRRVSTGPSPDPGCIAARRHPYPVSRRVSTSRHPGQGPLPQRQRRDRPVRRPKPGRHRPTIRRKRVPQHRPMARQSRAVRPAGRHDHPDRHRQRIPAAFTGDLPRESTPPTHLADQDVDVNDVRLQLDHDQGALARMPRQDIGHASLPEDRERDLRIQEPARQVLGEPARDRLVQSGMPTVDETIEIGTLDRAVTLIWTSSSRATSSSVPRTMRSRWPRSIREMTERSTPTRGARSSWRQPRRTRTARRRAPSCCI